MWQHETIDQWILTQEVVMWPHPYGSPIWSSQADVGYVSVAIVKLYSPFLLSWNAAFGFHSK
jgi:hypothetical protein